MTPILVFGADGQLGRDLLAHAAAAETALVGIGRAQADITDASAVKSVIERTSPALVVNAAAYTKVDRAEAEADEAFRANERGPRILAAACAAAKLPLLHISTDYVFDGTKPTAYREDDPISPLGVYGQSKATGEKAVRAELAQHVILRTSWVYGVYGANFLKTMIRLAASRDELRVVADQRGCPTGTPDIADAVLRIAPRLASGHAPWGTYHFVGSGVTTWHGFALEIVDAQALFTHRRPNVVAITTADYPTAAKRPANSELDCSLFATTFGFRAADWRERTHQVVADLLNAPGGAA